MTGSDGTRLADDGIDLDRVVVDPLYRRRVIERLRAEAARRPAPLIRTEPGPAPHAARDD
jgi:hypothetical protein